MKCQVLEAIRYDSKGASAESEARSNTTVRGASVEQFLYSKCDSNYLYLEEVGG